MYSKASDFWSIPSTLFHMVFSRGHKLRQRGAALGLCGLMMLTSSSAFASELKLTQMRHAHEVDDRFAVLPSYDALERSSDLELNRQLVFRRRPRMVPLGWEIAGLVLGAGTTAMGITLTALDGRCAKYHSFGSEYPQCRQQYETEVAGLAALTSGLMVFGSSVVMMLIDARRGWDPEVRYYQTRRY